jgi:uncharacterized protein with PIN domain
MEKEKLIKEVKEKVAEWHGYELSMPTKWNYAMVLHHRTKQQILLYEEVISLLADIIIKEGIVE